VPDRDDLLVVGRIGPPNGVHGAVVVHAFTDAPDERFAAGAVLLTAGEPLTVQALRWQGKRLVVQFVGVADRDQAQALRGTDLRVAASSRPALEDPDDFYDSDLIGLAASTVDGEELGPVRDVVHSPASDYLVVEVGGREHLVPFIAVFVPVVDVVGGRVVLDPPEGLFEL